MLAGSRIDFRWPRSLKVSDGSYLQFLFAKNS
jgi:hypothetical protein